MPILGEATCKARDPFPSSSFQAIFPSFFRVFFLLPSSISASFLPSARTRPTTTTTKPSPPPASAVFLFSFLWFARSRSEQQQQRSRDRGGRGASAALFRRRLRPIPVARGSLKLEHCQSLSNPLWFFDYQLNFWNFVKVFLMVFD